MTRILLIDDDPLILQLLKLFFENGGYEVFTAESGPAGLEIAAKHPPDLVILDVMLPIMDGYETSRRLRELGTPSILMISSRHDERSVVKALELGADDYLRKPFELPVLLAKTRNLLRRAGQRIPSGTLVYDDGRLFVDLDKRRIEVRGEPVQLTATEFRLMSVLLRNAGRVVTHEELIREIWGTEKDSSLASLKLYIHYLRRKIEDHPRDPYYLLAEWGIGYRFREPNPVAQSAKLVPGPLVEPSMHQGQ